MDTAGKKVRKRAKEKPYLPDEIIKNILIRLPVKSLVRFELVCRKWRDMILARDFVDLHRRSGFPVILVASTFKKHLDLFAIDKWWDLARTRSMIHRFPFRASHFPDVNVRLFSHAGLIVLGGSLLAKPKIRILNPARPSDECVVINMSERFWMTADICAIYYHPSLNEYCSLWSIHKSGQPEAYQYKVLNLGSNPSFKMVCNSFDYYRVKDEHAYPLFVSDHLYWMLKPEQGNKFGGRNDILEFDIITEEFTVIPCPIPLNTKCNKHQTHLLNIDGVISFLLILPSTITIWTLKDHVDYLWTATEYTTSIDICDDFYEDSIIAFVDGKLSFGSDDRLFVCNLMEGTVKKYPKWHDGGVSFLSHQMSMASLKNCRSKLYINRDGEVLV